MYNEPREPLASIAVTLLLTLVPGLALALLVRKPWPYVTGVALGIAAAVAVAVQIARTDDAQAGLAVLALPIYLTAAVAIAFVLDQRSARRSQ